ncbi:MAG: DUF1254 domain-containing protein [Deltaproteobacteria bacterium]|nr:DUF1254 domain-containing protein [Deltaproteobacteria bacterium]
MTTTHRWTTLAICLLLASGCGMKGSSGLKGMESGLKAHEAKETAVDAYIYGYPLVTMEMTRRIMTNVATPAGMLAPMGQFARVRAYPGPDDKDVTAPNADTLYTVAWLDVSKEPWVLSVPDMKDRYFLLPMLDGWTDVFQVPGKRTTGTGAQKYAITGPGWRGTLPAGVTEYKSPTGMVWILGRIYCTGTPADYAAVHAAQDALSVVPLSSYGKPYTPPSGVVDPKIDAKTPTRDQVNALDGVAFFTMLAELMKTNPPAAADAAAVAKFAAIGLVPGRSFDAAKLDPAVLQGIQAAPKVGQEKIPAWMKEGVLLRDNKIEDGWLYTINTGVYGTNYRQRAFITWLGLGANRPQDAIYPTSDGPDVLAKYDGKKKYVMHFAKGALPPVNAFWSLTMYDENYFFVRNALHRSTLSQRDKLVANKDGSIDLYIQHESPGKAKEANWLPAPAGRFVLMMRMYWPKDKRSSILDGSWKIPRVHEAS